MAGASFVNKKGIVYVAALGLVVVLLNLGLAYVYVVRNEMDTTVLFEAGHRAFYHAENAAHHAIAEIIDGDDADGDGLGYLPPKDIDSDGEFDYSSTYSGGLVTATGASGNAWRTVIVEVSAGPWTGAFQIGGQISPVTTVDFSTITGDATSFLSMDPDFYDHSISGGAILENQNTVEIPTTDTSSMGPWSASADYTHVDCSAIPLNPPAGVHYVSGNCTLDFGSTGPFNLSGSLIVNGDLSISRVTNGFTVTPTGQNPALLASNQLSLTNLAGSVNITGLIYSGGAMNFTVWDYFAGHTINGAVVAGGNLSLTTIARTNYIFDSNLNPPHFNSSGGGSTEITLWRGHPQ